MQNENGTDRNWIVNSVRPTLDARGYRSVKIQAPDSDKGFWQIFDEFEKDPAYRAAVEAVGYHHCERTTEAIIPYGLWNEPGIRTGVSGEWSLYLSQLTVVPVHSNPRISSRRAWTLSQLGNGPKHNTRHCTRNQLR